MTRANIALTVAIATILLTASPACAQPGYYLGRAPTADDRNGARQAESLRQVTDILRATVSPAFIPTIIRFDRTTPKQQPSRIQPGASKPPLTPVYVPTPTNVLPAPLPSPAPAGQLRARLQQQPDFCSPFLSAASRQSPLQKRLPAIAGPGTANRASPEKNHPDAVQRDSNVPHLMTVILHLCRPTS